MNANPTRAALILIDMENGFVEPEGGHCIRFAKSTVPACCRAVELARERASPSFSSSAFTAPTAAMWS